MLLLYKAGEGNDITVNMKDLSTGSLPNSDRVGRQRGTGDRWREGSNGDGNEFEKKQRLKKRQTFRYKKNKVRDTHGGVQRGVMK